MLIQYKYNANTIQIQYKIQIQYNYNTHTMQIQYKYNTNKL